jgi:hypothetical protein
MEMPWKILKSVCWCAINDLIWVMKICSCSINCFRCCVVNNMSRGEKRRCLRPVWRGTRRAPGRKDWRRLRSAGSVVYGLLRWWRQRCPWTSKGEKAVKQEASRRCEHTRRARQLWQWGVGGGQCGNLDARPGLVLGWMVISVDGWVAIGCCVVLCCVVLRWVVLCCDALCFNELCCVVEMDGLR